MNKNKRRCCLLLLLPLLCCACSNTATQEQKTAAAQDTLNPEAPGTAAIPAAWDALILNATDYHGDEVPAGAAGKTWTGLFKGPEGYYIDATTITTTTVYDPVVDEEEQGIHTGIAVRAQHKDTAIMLASGIPYLRKGVVKEASFSGSGAPLELQPGDSIRFGYGGKNYILLARGNRKPLDDAPGSFAITDYRLYLSGTKDGKPVQQLLTAQNSFDDTMIGVLFCGDLDGDSLPDFIINTSNHYNVFQPTLYLSSQAPAGQLLLRAAQHTSVGC